MKHTYVGAAYYPEVWEDADVLYDLKKMKEMGINCIRIGEFAWSTLEPREGEYDFSRFAEIIDMAAKEDIAVVLCTPSATLPKWLINAYPECMQVSSMGVRAQFGGRAHACKNNPSVREKTRFIIEKTCKALGNKPNVIGWQIDNEIYPYDNGCHCSVCVEKFRKYMAGKYGDIATLNRSYNASRWSLTYPSFEDIIPPRQDTWNHPSLVVDWLEYQGEVIIEFVQEQAAEIRKHTSLPIGTDMMTNPDLSHEKMNRGLDVVQINHYEKEGSYYKSLFWLDYMRSLKETSFWMTETSPGWFGAHTADGGARKKRAMYNNVLATFLKGGNMHLFWLFRAHPCGQELMHAALLDCTGRETLFTGEISAAFQTVRQLEGFFNEYRAASKTALVYSNTSVLQFKAVPMVEGFDYVHELTGIYGGLLNYGMDVVDVEASLDGYERVITPYLSHISETQRAKLLAFVENGGTWVVGPMADVFDGSLKRYLSAPFGCLEQAGGVRLQYAVPVHHEEYAAAFVDGAPLKVRGYYDGYSLDGAISLAAYTQGELKGLHAVTEKGYGKGKIILVGSMLDGESYARLTGIVPILPASQNVALNRLLNKEGKVALSCIEAYGKAGFIELDKAYRDLLTGKTYRGRVEISSNEVYLFIED